MISTHKEKVLLVKKAAPLLYKLVLCPVYPGIDLTGQLAEATV